MAVKQIMEVDASEASMTYSLKNLATLDKFRCDRGVHFYGACTIPNHIMMMLEFVPCGSLMDFSNKRPELSDEIEAKILLNEAKGLAYLHVNDTLHRDIKPDNVLVFSLERSLRSTGS